MKIHTYFHKEYFLGDTVLIKPNVDIVYSDYVNKTGVITKLNDDNSFTVQIDDDIIYVFDHEFE